MGRSCGPCRYKARNELDSRLLKMDITGETYRGLSQIYGYSEDALSRHRMNHLKNDLADVHAIMEQAREQALQEVKQQEQELIKAEAANTMSGRLALAADFIEQLQIVRQKAADLLDQAQLAEDLQSCVGFLREIRQQIKLLAELEGRLALKIETEVKQPVSFAETLTEEEIDKKTSGLAALSGRGIWQSQRGYSILQKLPPGRYARRGGVNLPVVNVHNQIFANVRLPNQI
jgi:hypothetical protein